MRYTDMPADEFKEHVRLLASTIAFQGFQRRQPAASADQAHAYAGRFWRRYVDTAIDILALEQAADEAAAAVGNN